MKAWKTLSREVILDQGKFLVVEKHVVELPDGTVIPDWTWIITPDYINILPVTPEGNLLLFRQVKYAVGGECLGIIGGYLEPGEAPLDGAKRELLEETGYSADRWVSLGSFTVDANRGAGKANFFLALDATRTASPHPDDLEEQVLIQMSQPDLEAALLGGQFSVLSWAGSAGLALLYLKQSAKSQNLPARRS